MGGKLGKAHNSYVVSGGEAGGSQSSGATEEYLEDRRHSESDLNYSGGASPLNLLTRVSAKVPSLKQNFCLDEPVYKNSEYRRKSVFAEAYNPEDDEGDETKVCINTIGYLLFTK